MAPNINPLETAIDRILTSPDALEVLLQRLESKDLHVLRGLDHMKVSHPDRRAAARTAIVLDTETTGLDPKTDKVIQLGMIKVLYDDDGVVEITDEVFDQMQDPGFPLDPKITELTGISDADLAGKSIDHAEVTRFIEGADLVIAHHSNFDRKFMEKGFEGFDKKNWACTIEDVDWSSRHSGSVKLELLMMKQGYVYPAHNALADIRATAFLLSRDFGKDTSVMQDVLESIQRTPAMVLATGLPFGRQDPLKAAGFKWSADRDGGAGEKCWWKKVSTPQEAEDAAKALREAFGGDVMLPVRRFNPKNSYSDRLPPIVKNAFETKNPLKAIGVADVVPERDELSQTSFSF